METTGYHHQATLDHQSITAAAAAAAAHKQIIHHHQQQQFYHHDDKLNQTSTQPAGKILSPAHNAPSALTNSPPRCTPDYMTCAKH